MIYQLVGLCLFFAGFSHKLDYIHKLEPRILRFIQDRFGRSPYLAFFKELWFLGRSTFTVIVLLLLIVYNWKLGLSSLAVFGLIAGLEKLLKITFQRDRPYKLFQDIQMLQPSEPVDQSFPSGDALRIWFLAMILAVAMGNSLLLVVITALLASLVSVGRMVLGVHFPTDVLTGVGLGFLGAGTTIWLWQIFHLL